MTSSASRSTPLAARQRSAAALPVILLLAAAGCDPKGADSPAAEPATPPAAQKAPAKTDDIQNVAQAPADTSRQDATQAAQQPAQPSLASLWRWNDALENSSIELTIEDGKVSGTGGVNRYHATAVVDGADLSFGPLAVTRRAGPPPLAKQEHSFLEKLAQVRAFVIEGSTLRLLGEADEKLLVFSYVPPAALTGNEWSVTGVNNGKGGVESVSPSIPLTITFDSEGRVTGFAGCNRFKGTYESTDDTLQLTPIVATRRLCTKPEGAMQHEEHFMKAMPKAAAYSISADQLELRDDKGSLMVRAILR